LITPRTTQQNSSKNIHFYTSENKGTSRKWFCWGDTLKISNTSLHRQKLESLGYHFVENHMMIIGLLLLKLYHIVTDRRTDSLGIPITVLAELTCCKNTA